MSSSLIGLHSDTPNSEPALDDPIGPLDEVWSWSRPNGSDQQPRRVLLRIKTLLSPTVQMVFPGMGDTLPSDEDGALTRHFTASDGHSCIKKDEEGRSGFRKGSGNSRLMNQPMAPREGMVRDRRTTDFLIATERRSLGRTPLLLMNRDGVR